MPQKQDSGIDRRDFRVPDSFAGIDVGEVIEKSAMRRQLSPKKYERRDDAQPRVLVGDKAAFFCDADGRQAEAGRRDAGDDAGVVAADIAAVFDQAGLRIGLLPEIEEAGCVPDRPEISRLQARRAWPLEFAPYAGLGVRLCQPEEPPRGRAADPGRYRPFAAATAAGIYDAREGDNHCAPLSVLCHHAFV